MGSSLEWDGCFNARDLGGLPARDARRTRQGAIIRSDQLCYLTSEGWAAVYSYGIRTVIDLQDHDSSKSDRTPRPAGIATLHLPLEDRTECEFWETWGASTGRYSTPLYYRPFLDRFPDRCVAVMRAIAIAAPGGVVIHCRLGRDRTGLIAMLALAAVGVDADRIADDYELSARYLPALFRSLGEDDEGPIVERILEREGTTARAAIHRALEGLDVGRYLSDHGLRSAEAKALAERFLSPAGMP
jgi:protein-tyrosine phosphatase